MSALPSNAAELLRAASGARVGKAIDARQQLRDDFSRVLKDRLATGLLGPDEYRHERRILGEEIAVHQNDPVWMANCAHHFRMCAEQIDRDIQRSERIRKAWRAHKAAGKHPSEWRGVPA